MYLGQQIIVGLDCEWRPNTSPTMNDRTATQQLCVDGKCLILQLFYMDSIPQSLKDFISDPNVTVVGVEVQRVVAKLLDEYGLNCSRISDVREVTLSGWPSMFYKEPGLKHIAYRVVGCPCQSQWMFAGVIGNQGCMMLCRLRMLPLMLMLLIILAKGFLMGSEFINRRVTY